MLGNRLATICAAISRWTDSNSTRPSCAQSPSGWRPRPRGSCGAVARKSSAARHSGNPAVLRCGPRARPTDPVTIVDTETERLLRDRLAELRPGERVLGEEGGGSAEDSDGRPTWVLDPIDGTVNFVYGLPAYVVSVAVQVDGAVARRSGRQRRRRRPVLRRARSRRARAARRGVEAVALQRGRRPVNVVGGHRIRLRPAAASTAGGGDCHAAAAGARHPAVRVGGARPVPGGRGPTRCLLRGRPQRVGLGRWRADRGRGGRAPAPAVGRAARSVARAWWWRPRPASKTRSPTR